MKKKSQTGLIYMITCPDGKKYVGQTRKTFNQRKKGHIRDSEDPHHRTRPIARALHKHKEMAEWEILISGVPVHLLNKIEGMAMRLYETIGENGLNCRSDINKTPFKPLSKNELREEHGPVRSKVLLALRKELKKKGKISGTVRDLLDYPDLLRS